MRRLTHYRAHCTQCDTAHNHTTPDLRWRWALTHTGATGHTKISYQTITDEPITWCEACNTGHPFADGATAAWWAWHHLARTGHTPTLGHEGTTP